MTDHPDNARRRLLLISYWYPPAIGAAAERAHAFAQHLPDNGWQMAVVTARRPGGSPSCAGVSVIEAPDRLAETGRPFADYDPRRRPSRLRALLRHVIFPDRFAPWQRAALAPACEAIREHRPDLILASFPPASAVLLALRLHRKTGLPLVLDFRDRWFGPGGYEPRCRLVRFRHRRLCEAAVSAASALITVSDAMADAAAHEHGIARDRIIVSPNGYEPVPRTAQLAAPRSSGEHLTIAHVGTVIPRNRPDLFFEAVAALGNRECLDDITFNFVGNLSRAYLDDAGLSPCIRTTGLLPRDRAWDEARSADALLLLTGRYVGRWGYNAKLFEYLQTGLPILCLEESPGSNDGGLLQRLAPERAFIAPVDDPDAIAAQLEELKRYVRRHPEPTESLVPGLEAYSRPSLVADLAEHLHRLVRSGLGQHSN